MSNRNSKLDIAICSGPTTSMASISLFFSELRRVFPTIMRWLLPLLFGQRVASRKIRYRGSRKNAVRAWRKPEWVICEVIRLKALMPDAGARRIALCFNRRFEARKKTTVSKSFVAYTLRREAYRVAEIRRAVKRRQAKPGQCNLVWGMDLTGKQSDDGIINPILGIVDHGTRMLLRLDIPERSTSWTLLGYLFLAIGRHGKPKAVRTDNGPAFVSHLFRLVLHLAGIRHQRTEPGCSWMNGRIERLFGTLKEKLDCLQVATPQALSGTLRDFRFWYNRVRPHQNIGGRTPYEAWRNVDPYAKPPKRIEWFSAWGGLLTRFHHRR